MSQDNNSSFTVRQRGVKRETSAQSVQDNSVFFQKSLQPEIVLSASYWLTRIVLIRSLSFIYVVAFLVAFFQNKQLIGKHGLLPTDKYLDEIIKHTDNQYSKMIEFAPTFYWIFDYHKHCNTLLDVTAITGFILSLYVLISGCANVFIMLFLWILYHSLVAVGQRWYSFGWESQLLETGFLSIFLCPMVALTKFPANSKPSFIAILCFRWLIFRIMIGAGLIKLRGDACWKDLTCMNYHYQTQPVPNPISYFMHQEPEAMHKFETMSNHFIELLAPWLLLLPGIFTAIGGGIQIIFQVVLIISGNLSFLNWLTIVPSLSCFDDTIYSRIFSKASIRKVIELQNKEKEEIAKNEYSWRKFAP